MNHPHPGLPYPAKLAKKTLRIVALGGLGEIGRNMTVFEYEGRLLIVDCGVLFPEESQPGPMAMRITLGLFLTFYVSAVIFESSVHN